MSRKMGHDYSYYVTEGKKLLHAVDVYQCLIAWYASQVVEIKHGGRTQGYTLTEYAKDIGVNRKTLCEWSQVYRNVVEKLQIDPSNITEEQWAVAKRVSNLLRAEKRAIQEQSGQKRKKGRGWNFNVLIPPARVRDLFNSEMNGRTAQSEINGHIDSVINIKNKLRRMHLDSVSEVSLRSLKMNLDEASSEITNHLLGSRGFNISEVSCANTLS